MAQSDSFATEGVDLNRDQRQAFEALAIPDGTDITVHLVAQSHLDLLWFWPMVETVEMNFGLFDEALRQVETFPGARFMQGQMIQYRALRDLDPEAFARVQRAVAAGRWFVQGGQVVEPDHNLPGAESLARQFLYGQRLARALFGRTCTYLVNQDSFGHPRSLPQVLALVGIRGFVFKRPRPRYVRLMDVPFWWEGIDGTRILAKRSNNKGIGVPGTEMPPDPDKSPLQSLLDWHLALGITHLYAPIGTSDTGGLNPYVPGARGKGWTMQQSSPAEYFEAVREQGSDRLPVYAGRLNYVYPGCYTTRLIEKEESRTAEEGMLRVETLCVLARLHGHASQAAEVEQIWWRLCFAHFHDCITGTGSPHSHGESRHNYAQIFFDQHRLTRRNERYLLRRINTAGPGHPVVVFNGLAWARGGIVDFDVVSSAVPADPVLVDDGGQVSPCETTAHRKVQAFTRTHLRATVGAVPGCGYRTFWLRERRPDDALLVEDPDLRVSQRTITNRHLALAFDEHGRMISMLHKASAREFLLPGGTRWEVWPETDYVYDYGSPMKPWSLGITDRHTDLDRHYVHCVVQVDGPLAKGIRIVHRYCDSRFEMTYLLLPDTPHVLLVAHLDWHERERLLRFAIPPALPPQAQARFEIAFGAETADKTEVELPVHNWLALYTEEAGLGLCSRRRFGHTFRDNVLRVSAARCAVGQREGISDEGEYTFSMLLVPFVGPWEQAELPRLAWAFRHPLWSRSDPALSGDGPAVAGLLDVSGQGVVVSTVKEAEEGEGTVVRLFETLGQATTAHLHFGDGLAVTGAEETNLLEEPTATLDPALLAALPLRPFEIRTLRVFLRRR